MDKLSEAREHPAITPLNASLLGVALLLGIATMAMAGRIAWKGGAPASIAMIAVILILGAVLFVIHGIFLEMATELAGRRARDLMRPAVTRRLALMLLKTGDWTPQQKMQIRISMAPGILPSIDVIREGRLGIENWSGRSFDVAGLYAAAQRETCSPILQRLARRSHILDDMTFIIPAMSQHDLIKLHAGSA